MSCGPHPSSKLKSKPKEVEQWEVVIILSSFVASHDHDILGSVSVEEEISYHPWLTTTEDLLSKLIKRARAIGANAITNLEIGSYDLYGHFPADNFVGYKHRIYAKGTALQLHDFVGAPSPNTIAKDQAYIRIQSTEHPPEHNALVLLSPFLKRTDHQVIGNIHVTWDGTKSKVGFTVTEQILQDLMRDAVQQGANAISELDIGSFVLVGHMHQEDVAARKHTAYGKALAIKILPKKKRE